MAEKAICACEPLFASVGMNEMRAAVPPDKQPSSQVPGSIQHIAGAKRIDVPMNLYPAE